MICLANGALHRDLETTAGTMYCVKPFKIGCSQRRRVWFCARTAQSYTSHMVSGRGGPANNAYPFEGSCKPPLNI